MTVAGFLDKERTIAGPGFKRWLVPPAALAIHLCIGMAYGFSVFWLPLSKAIGIKESVACPADMGFLAEITASTCDWKISMLGWMFTLFFVFLGLASALFGGWLEHAGPRKAGLVSALCWCGGLTISALGIYLHQIWLMWLGSGVIGGIGLGLGYISPVSTLIKWFPDRRGMATGMAIMGFGGGAMIGAPLADKLMKTFATAHSVGVWETFLVLAAIYLVFMVGGALAYRVPATGWKPVGWTPPAATSSNAMITTRHVHVNKVLGIPQFWLVWLVLFLNVSAGIGILAMASPLLQEVFGGRLIGVNAAFNDLDTAQKAQIATIAAGFTGLLSLFNIGGRFAWASCSDYIGRKTTYAVFLALGCVLYAAIPSMAHGGHMGLFVAFFCLILSMYGGGFATVPAYLADLFGTQMVGAIHGVLLTAWAAAGVLGTSLVNYLREYQIAHGVPKAEAYDTVMYVLAGLLVLGFLCNLLVRPVAARHFMSEQELLDEKRLAHERSAGGAVAGVRTDALAGGVDGALVAAAVAAPVAMTAATTALPVSVKTATTAAPLVLLAWAVVGIPLLVGVWITLQKVAVLFH